MNVSLYDVKYVEKNEGEAMKIRKATINENTENIFIYENKKEEYTVVAIPSIEWSTVIPYEEETISLKTRMLHSLVKRLEETQATNIGMKITQWVREM